MVVAAVNRQLKRGAAIWARLSLCVGDGASELVVRATTDERHGTNDTVPLVRGCFA